jgi:hypothetical protein
MMDALRGMALVLGGREGPERVGEGRKEEMESFKYAYNRLATCLQLACNYGPALPMIYRCPTVALI